MFYRRSNGELMWENWGKCGVHWSCKYLNPGEGVANITYLLILRNGGVEKTVSFGNIWWLVRITGEPSMITLCKHTGAIRSTNINSHFLLIWRFGKPCAGKRRPEDDIGCNTRPCKCDNERQWRNYKLCKHELDALIETTQAQYDILDLYKNLHTL